MERTQEVIIDASVVIKWFSQEEGTERAVQVRNDHIEGKTNLIAPDLLIYEILNALRFKKGFDAPTVAQAVNDLLDLRMDIMTPTREVMNKSSELAYKYDITSYDSYYLAFGETLGIKVLTADNRLYKKAKECKILSLL